MINRKLSKAAVDKEPYLVWNEFVDILAMESEDDLTENQKVAQRAFWYDSEVQNGGHLQYFENQNRDDYSIIIEAIKQLGAVEQANILEKAVAQIKSKKRSPIKKIVTFVKRAREGEFDDFDSEYHEAQPSLNDLLEKYLDKNIHEFIIFEE